MRYMVGILVLLFAGLATLTPAFAETSVCGVPEGINEFTPLNLPVRTDDCCCYYNEFGPWVKDDDPITSGTGCPSECDPLGTCVYKSYREDRSVTAKVTPEEAELWNSTDAALPVALTRLKTYCMCTGWSPPDEWKACYVVELMGNSSYEFSCVSCNPEG